MDLLVDGWQHRTEQKLVFAGCMAALLSLRKDPLRTKSKLRDFSQKLVGYGGAAVVFSGIQETCRTARGRHDFLNSAVSGAITGALVVGHYQGPKYRLLGVVTWGSLGALMHITNSLLQPRHRLEDYLISEGLLSPEATRYRQAPVQQSPSSEVGLLFPEYEHREVLLQAKAIKERELREMNEMVAAAAKAGSRSAAGAAAGRAAAMGAAAVYDIEGDIDDDDPGYQVWLRTSGFEADVLLQSQPQQQRQQPQQQPGLEQQLAGGAKGADAGGVVGEGGGEAVESDAGWSRAGGGAAAAPARKWSVWLTPWKWGSGRTSPGASDSGEQRSRD